MLVVGAKIAKVFYIRARISEKLLIIFTFVSYAYY